MEHPGGKPEVEKDKLPVVEKDRPPVAEDTPPEFAEHSPPEEVAVNHTCEMYWHDILSQNRYWSDSWTRKGY